MNPASPVRSTRPQPAKINANPTTANVVLAIGVALSVALTVWTARLVEREAR